MPSLCISIVSHNRAADLERTLKHIQQLSPQPEEVRILLDRCTDNSKELCIRLMPEAHIEATDVGGSIPNRDAIIRTTPCDLILSLDDDSYPIQLDALRVVKAIMEDSPRCGVLTFPQVSDEFPDQVIVPRSAKIELASFQNSGAVIRRDAYMQTHGYPRAFFHTFEEPDLCLQLIDHGWKVLESTDISIRHHYSQNQRNEWRVHANQARNEYLSLLLRCPSLYLPTQLTRVVLGQARYAFRRGWIHKEIIWWIEALRSAPKILKQRSPVSQKSFKYWRSLLHTPQSSET